MNWDRVREWFSTRICLDCLGNNCPACNGCDCDNDTHTEEA